ncbi:MAG: ABC transporter substrate-binding protein [Chloroflexi bacterium]|nr:ABC transporter substrate-binding protein [Chloroflexota bacterium]MCY4008411.1 ABC transporter substrate-binding protein [Anaerolineaceae bacterium]MCY4105211.1 ABC transporter substrate-binding protein [Chloroflexota bacterium]
MRRMVGVLVLVSLLSVTAGAQAQDELVEIRLQLQWVTQSQFAGYYAARDLGFFEEEGLDVTILEGAVELVPQQVVASGGAEFGLSWVPKVLESNEAGVNLVNIAQVFQRSGTLMVSFVDTGVETVEDFAGLRVGTWGFGNEHELFAAMRAVGIDPQNPNDVTIIRQPFDMSQLHNHELDVAQAMTYNEYAQVLEQVNPDTGELYQPEDLNVIDFNEVGTAMLQDLVFASADWLAEEGNEEIAVAFLRGAFRGWIHCRENFDECVEIVLDNGSTLGESHQQWQLNEINKLIWPSPNGIGIMNPDLWEQTVAVAIDGGVIMEEPHEGSYRTDLAQAALDSLSEEYDVIGDMWVPEYIALREGGN